MEIPQTSCPKCGALTIQGQLVPTKDFAAGFLTILLTDDAAAGLMASNSGKLVVQAFCLSCGTIWLPVHEYLVHAIRGDHGLTAQERARKELEGLVGRAKGFKLVSGEEQKTADWAQSLLNSASTRPPNK